MNRIVAFVCRAGRRPAVVAALWLSCAATLPPSARGDAHGDQQLADFLDRLGLIDLQVIHLEQVLQGPLAEDQQQRLARRLGDLYAGQLMDDPADEESRSILQRIDALLARFPQADTPALRVMLLQAEYNRAESLAVRWIGDSTERESRDRALDILQRIVPELTAHQSELNAQVDHLTNVLADIPEGDQRDAKEQSYARVRAAADRATYFAAWSRYYLGLMNGAEGGEGLRSGRDLFRTLLDIQGDDYGALDPEWLGLESVGRCRALIGLGLVEAALGELSASRECFDLLEHPRVPPEMQDQAAFWYLQGLLNAGRLEEAAEYAHQRIGDFGGQASQGKVSLCVALVRAAFDDRAATLVSVRRRLAILGIEGLARLGQQQTVEQLLEQYPIDLEDLGGFFLIWVDGRRLLAMAEQSKQPEAYRVAAQRLQAALDAPDAERQIGSAARCRYQLAWCFFQLHEYEQAGRLYRLASTGLKAADPATAAQAAWMAFASYQRLADEQPRFTSLAIDALQTLKRDFPSHPYAMRAEYYIGRMQRHAESPEQTLHRLQKIPADDPSYRDALYDLCVVAHEVWGASDQSARPEAGRRVIAAARRYLDMPSREGDAVRRVKCCLVAAEVALAGAPAEATEAAVFLEQAAADLDRLPESSSLLAEYHYRGLQLSAARQDEAGRLHHARWLARHATGTAYELPALIVLARGADRQVAQAQPDDQPAARQQAYEIYRQLVQHLGSSAERVQHDPNARVALSRWAQYAAELDHHEQAASLLETLARAFPADKNYLRRAGLAHLAAAQYEQSLDYWRKLLAGLDSGEEAWYEAKYFQVRCLKHTDPAMAERVLKQFQLLHPQLGPVPWRAKFRALIEPAR